MNKFAFTCGDINGIGPEIVVKCLNKISLKSNDKFIFICPKNVFLQTTQSTVSPKFDYEFVNNVNNVQNVVSILDIGDFNIETGFPTKSSGKAAFKSIKKSFQLAHKKEIDGIITAPISKTAINLAGYYYPGHTEMYAEWANVSDFVMMFLSKKMIAALATIHQSIKKIPSQISKKRLNKILEVIFNTARYDLKINKPRIAILGLNPHAGENGLIGHEEELIIKPVIKNSKFIDYISGPFSPDAFFANKSFKKFNVILGMYHDQILIPFKMINFGKGVNYTAGLPFVRTSPDHGVAFDIAGKNLADENSIIHAFLYAKRINNNRKMNEKSAQK